MPFKQEIAKAVSQVLDTPLEQVLPLIETPPDPALGDYALPCFAFAKTLRKAPQLIAKSIVESAMPACVVKAEVAGGYANFTVDKALYARTVLDQALLEGERYGAQDIGHGRTVCIDYSSINIAKQFHIGHLSSTAIGHALYNLYNFMGYKSIGINHLGDWGTQFGKLLAAYELWGDEAAVREKGVEEMTRLYVKFHEEAEKDPQLEDLGRAWFKRIEDGDEIALALFDQFKQATIQEVMKIYDLLGITFDSYNGEAFYNDKMQPVVDELRAKHLLTPLRGRVCGGSVRRQYAALYHLEIRRHHPIRHPRFGCGVLPQKNLRFCQVLVCGSLSAEPAFPPMVQSGGKDGLRLGQGFGACGLWHGLHGGRHHAFHQKGPCGAAQGCAAQRHRARGRNFGGKISAPFGQTDGGRAGRRGRGGVWRIVQCQDQGHCVFLRPCSLL